MKFANQMSALRAWKFKVRRYRSSRESILWLMVFGPRILNVIPLAIQR